MHFISRTAIIVCLSTLVACGGGAETTSSAPPETPVTTLSVSASGPASESPSGTVSTFRITASRTSTSSIDIVYETLDGSAIAGADYAQASGRVSLPAGLTSVEIDVAVLDDSLDEPDEDFSFRLLSVSSGTLGTSSASANIVDDDPAVTINISDASIVEGDSGQVTVDFSLGLTAVSGFDVSVDHATIDGTATAGMDYQAQSGTLIIPAGSTTATLSVPVFGDTVDEGNESFGLQLSNALHANLSGAMATATIIDNDNPSVPSSLTVSVSNAASVSESSAGSTLQFPIALSETASVDIDIQYESANQSAIAGEDFLAAAGTVTVLAGGINASVSVPVTDDTLFEGDEALLLRITGVSNGSIANAIATGVILNDDAAPMLLLSDASLTEGDAGQQALQFTLSQSAVSGLDSVVGYTTVDGTAAAGDDYQFVSGTATIAAGAAQTTIQVDVSGDTLNEPDETLQVVLSGAQNASIADGTGLGTIVNNDSLPSISIADASITEGDTGQSNLSLTVSLSSVSGSTVTVDYASSDGTAIAGEDYTATSGTATINAGTTSTTVSVPITGDSKFEADETFTVGLSNAVNGSIADGAATGTLSNDDSAPGLSISDESIAEGDAGQAILGFTVSLDAVSGVDATLNYSTIDGTATAGEDYVASSGQLTIPAGDLQGSISVPVIGDTVDEPNETFSVSLSGATNSSIVDGTGVGTITDGDSLSSISIASASVLEGDSGSAQLVFTISLSAVSGSTVTVDYASSDGTAIAGVDYTATSGTATIIAGDNSTTVSVGVLSDQLDEADESLTLTLSNPGSASLGTAAGAGTIIDDDDQPLVSIADVSIIEGDSGQSSLSFSLSLSSASGRDVSFDYVTSDGSATAAEDYVSGSGSALINAGNTSTIVSINILGDILFEADESVNVTLSSVVNASLGDGVATGTITNDDAPPSVSIADTTLTEPDAGQVDASFVVSLDAVSGLDATVTFSSGSVTATSGTDFVSASGVATILAGDLQTTVDVSVLGDVIDEPDESYSVTLSDPVNVTINDGVAAGVIEDNDPVPAISIADASAAEGDSGQTSLNFVISIDAGSGFDVSVDYSTSDDSALTGDDYIATSGSATIVAGAMSTSISVTINGDPDEEGDESFFVNLSNGINASIFDASATGTISGDDGSSQSGLSSRPSNSSCVAPARPTNNAAIDNEIAFPSLPAFVKPVSFLQAPNDTSTWYVVEQNGRILSFDNSAAASSTSTFIDISSGSPIDVESGPQEAGLFGIAFDPAYGTGNWDAYISYTLAGSPLTSVIARIRSTDNGLTLDASTAEVLMTLDQPFDNHNGGHLLFGPDGYLYITFGDGGSGNDPGDRAQDTSNLFGTLLRIDVSSGSPYSIPTDNPFFGSALCNTGSSTESCPEIFAWGLRNAWRYSFDDATSQLWLADVGQAQWEEVNLIELGGNYGWRCKEGSSPYITSGNCPPGLIDPIIEYSSQTVGDSITGGEVYRGSAIPELTGRYIFADYVRGKIFASVDNGDGTYGYETLQDTSQFISSFAKEANGELLYLDYGSGLIRRIIQAGGSSINTIPDLLSDTGCVSVADVTQPADGLIPYDINVPFWSDGAVKERYYAISDGTTIDVASDGDWLFPNGTILVKNFRLNGSLIETRLFMRHTDGEWGGYTYEWNAGETEATRVVGGKTKSIDGQDWIYPSGSECIQCHTAIANYSLGLEHGQLNKDLTYPSTGITANQLTTADAVDLLTNPLSDTVQNLPKYPEPTNVAETLEERARAYLHTNCSGCHRPAGPTPSDMDLRYPTPFNLTGTCNVIPNSVTLGLSNARLIMPGDASSSLVVARASRRDIHGMPPLGSTIVDATGVQLLTDWINALSGCP